MTVKVLLMFPRSKGHLMINQNILGISEGGKFCPFSQDKTICDPMCACAVENEDGLEVNIGGKNHRYRQYMCGLVSSDSIAFAVFERAAYGASYTPNEEAMLQ